jgi:hypothetical protein
MNAPRLLFAFALAFALGIAATVATQHHRHTGTPVASPTSNKSTADDQATSSDQPEPGDDDSQGDAPGWPDGAPTPEQVLYSQPQMLREADAKLMPRAPDKVNLYIVAFAGNGEENVFRNEAEYADKLLTRRFGAAGHDLLLVNSPATLTQYPLASLSNLEGALAAVGEKMDRSQDVLMLFLTSHGSRDHLLYVNMDPLPLDQIAPEDLAGALAKAGIRNKVIVISACYSGGFIDALKDETTMVITAARADRPSFGCGSDSDITDFGRAFFVEGLNHNDSFPAAFAEAKRLIETWETRDGEDPSYPQMVMTPQIEAKLKVWRSGITLGAPVPFAAPAQPADRASLTAMAGAPR